MKIYIITRHNISNFGSLLQAYATQVFFYDLGYDSYIIDYRSKKESVVKDAFNYAKSTNHKRKLLRKICFILFKILDSALNAIKFRKYRKRYLNMTKSCSDKEDLNSLCINNALVCAGSDQLWGLMPYDDIDCAYYLDFDVSNSKKIAFASSFGISEISNSIVEKTKGLIHDFSFISVREDSAVEILKKYYNVESSHILDPTLMVDSKVWYDLLPNYSTIKNNYVLIFKLHYNKDFDKYINNFCKKKNLKPVYLATSYKYIFRKGKKYISPDPSRFLELIKNAEYVLTDSFHCTVFSIIFNKKFIDIPSGRTNTRIESLLRLTKLENRLLTNYDDLELIDKEINYNEVNTLLDNERNKSNLIVKGILEGIK